MNKKIPNENGKEIESELLESREQKPYFEQQNPDNQIVSSARDNADPDPQSASIDFLVVGRYTVFLIVLYELQLLPMVGLVTYMVYGGLEPGVVSCGNQTFGEELNLQDSCKAYKQSLLDGFCADDRPTIDAQFESLSFEFGYVCDEIILVKKSISIQLFGSLCGTLLFAQLSDWFGRKKIMLFTYFGAFLSCLASSTAQSFFHFNVLYFFAKFFLGGYATITFVFLLENLPKRLRVPVLSLLSFSPNYIVFAGIAFLSGNWRTLLHILAGLHLAAFVALLFAFESPKWLLHKGRRDEAHQILNKIDQFNGTKRSRQIDQLIERDIRENIHNKKGSTKYNYLHLFCSWRLLSYTITIAYVLFSVNGITYTVLYSMDTLSGSIYWNMAIMGASRYVVNLAVAGIDYAVPKAGRKCIFLAVLSLIILANCLVLWLKIADWNEPMLIRVAMIATGVLCSQLHVINTIVTNELFPTPIRNVASSFTQMFGRIGGMVSPNIFVLAFY